MIRIFFVVYRRTLSPLLHFLAGPTGGCRFHPHCSEYSEEAVKKFGLVKGAWLSLCRIFSCHPWTRRPMHDPVPPVSNSVRPSGKV